MRLIFLSHSLNTLGDLHYIIITIQVLHLLNLMIIYTDWLAKFRICSDKYTIEITEKDLLSDGDYDG